MTVSPRSSPRERLEARLEALRKDEDLVKELEDRVAGYGKQAREEHEKEVADFFESAGVPMTPKRNASWEEPDFRPISPWTDMDTAAAASPAPATPSARPISRRNLHSAGPSVHGRRPVSPSLGTARSWSSLDTTSVDAAGDPVGGWKSMRDPMHPPPLKFGFESEAARRRQYAENVTPALLGPQEDPLGSAPVVRDTERPFALMHSPLPGTLRPRPKLERAQSLGWQHATRQAAWTAQALRPERLTQPPPPVPPDRETARARAAQRQHSPRGRPFERGLSADPRRRLLHLTARAQEAAEAAAEAAVASAARRGQPRSQPGTGGNLMTSKDAAARAAQLAIPARLSHKAKRALAFGDGRIGDEPLNRSSAQQLSRLVSMQPGASIVRKVRDLNSYAIPTYEAKAQRSVISTRIGSAHGGARQRLQWVGRHA